MNTEIIVLALMLGGIIGWAIGYFTNEAMNRRLADDAYRRGVAFGEFHAALHSMTLVDWIRSRGVIGK